MQTVLIVLAAYLLGSVSFAIVVSRVFALPDPRSYGSRNPGATNVLRSGSKAAAVLTLLGDAGKGWLAVWLAAQLVGAPAAAAVVAPLAGLAVFVGHLFPLFHASRAAKASPPRPGCCSASIPGSVWRRRDLVFRAVLPHLFARRPGRGPVRAALRLVAVRPAAAACCGGGDRAAPGMAPQANIGRLMAGTEPRIR